MTTEQRLIELRKLGIAHTGRKSVTVQLPESIIARLEQCAASIPKTRHGFMVDCLLQGIAHFESRCINGRD